MNPQYIEAYTVGAYWLRRLHKPEQARDFLFEGLHNNPGNSELLFDLGWLYNGGLSRCQPRPQRLAGGVALLGGPECQCQNEHGKPIGFTIEITMNLGASGRKAAHWPQAIQYLEMVKQVSPDPDAIQKQIDEAEQKMKSGK